MFLESVTFGILETHSVPEIGTPYKISSSKFILIFELKRARDKFQVTEIYDCHLGDRDHSQFPEIAT